MTNRKKTSISAKIKGSERADEVTHRLWFFFSEMVFADIRNAAEKTIETTKTINNLNIRSGVNDNPNRSATEPMMKRIQKM
jgi:hypothetical protein